jgi:hypothetical protein
VSEGRWRVGEAEIQNLIDEGGIEEVEPSNDHAELLIRQAETHLASASALVTTDPPGAFALLYDAARKSLGAVLAQQGLRATNKNGHRATQEAIEAQLGPNVRGVVRPFRALRIRRHEVEYPALDTLEVSAQEATEALEDAQDIVRAMMKLVPKVGPWHT